MRLFSLQLTYEPLISALGFTAAGIGEYTSYPYSRRFRQNKSIRTVAAIIMALTALLWAITFFAALWEHMAAFTKWVPPTMGK